MLRDIRKFYTHTLTKKKMLNTLNQKVTDRQEITQELNKHFKSVFTIDKMNGLPSLNMRTTQTLTKTTDSFNIEKK